MGFDLANSHICVWGKKGTGKSGFINSLMFNLSKTAKNYAAFDPMDEHHDYGQDDRNLVVVPTNRRGEKAKEQLQDVTEFVVHNRERFDYFFVDEINRFHQKGGQLNGPVADIIDYSAHYSMSTVYVARRPSTVHTSVRDLSDWHFVFRLTGSSDVRMLDEIVRGLGEKAARLDKYQFISVSPSGDMTVNDPVDLPPNHSKGF